MQLVGGVSRRQVWLAGRIYEYGCGYQEVGVVRMYRCVGIVVRRYIDFLVVLIPTPLVLALFFATASLLLYSFLKCFFFLYIYIYIYIYIY